MPLDNVVQGLGPQKSSHDQSDPANAFFSNASQPRVHTETHMIRALRAAHPQKQVTSISTRPLGCEPTLLLWADATGEATYEVALAEDDSKGDLFATHTYETPERRMDRYTGTHVSEKVKYGKYEYSYTGQRYGLYVCQARTSMSFGGSSTIQFLIHEKTARAQKEVTGLIEAAGRWASELHDEIWLFDQASWSKDSGLWKSVNKSKWDNVILDPERKKAIQDNASLFFDSQEEYESLNIPWKRGVIYHGPPGNGKTISIKALSNTLYARSPAIPTLYVKSFKTRLGPELGVQMIFQKARAEAPCLLVFEDLDSLVTDEVRSYFLNEVDGVRTNHGIMIIGSTNHLDRLDPGLSKRPSRVDRKFEFGRPDEDGRKRYVAHWRGELAEKGKVQLGEDFEGKVAGITEDFSFAYLQEALIAALLATGALNKTGESKDKTGARGLDEEVLWKEMQRQVQMLKDEM